MTTKQEGEPEGLTDDDIYFGKRVVVRELKVHGWVYESAYPGGSPDKIHGVQLDEVAWPPNFVATEVWHCRAKDLDPEEEGYNARVRKD